VRVKDWLGGLSFGTTDACERAVRRMPAHSNEWPWRWTPQLADEWCTDRRVHSGKLATNMPRRPAAYVVSSDYRTAMLRRSRAAFSSSHEGWADGSFKGGSRRSHIADVRVLRVGYSWPDDVVRRYIVQEAHVSTYPVLMHTALDSTDVRGLAEFYRDLLGLQYRPGDEPPQDGSADDEDWLVLVDSAGKRMLAFQEVSTLARPTWPSDDVPKQMHLDFRVPTVDELERHRQRAEELGATQLLNRTEDSGEPLYVLADPAGHPFCILVGLE